ncbi:MAG: hypothetical protein IT427_17565 [Pirellulales bacterium]|nr:hypothetical protein [Pirellulales bacterium]
MKFTDSDHIFAALDNFKIEVPSWGFADTGTRFGKYVQAAAARTLEEKLHDAGLVNRLTGACPTVAVHVQWDFQDGESPESVAKLANSFGVRIGSINPNLFQDQCYKFGSLCNADSAVRETALKHVAESIEIGSTVGSRHLTLWLADGSNYPGQEDLFARKHYLKESLQQISQLMRQQWKDATLLLEYKPFEPSFYHTDVADWGMAYVFCRQAGPAAKVLVDTGHHLPGANIAHIVSFLLDEDMLGGFHFNDRKYADDDLTLGSIDPHGAFLIFDQIAQYEFATGKRAQLAYMIDQSHNLKPKLEAMVQTVCEAQKLFVKAQLVDRKRLAMAQQQQDIVGSEMVLRDAYDTDVSELLSEWRRRHKLPENPLEQLRRDRVVEQLAVDRGAKRAHVPQPTAGSYA